MKPERRNRDFIVHQNSISHVAAVNFEIRTRPSVPKSMPSAHTCRPICPKCEVIGFELLRCALSAFYRSLSLCFSLFLSFLPVSPPCLHSPPFRPHPSSRFFSFTYSLVVLSTYPVASSARARCFNAEMAFIFVSSFLSSNLSQPVCRASGILPPLLSPLPNPLPLAHSPRSRKEAHSALETASKNDYSEINNNDITAAPRSIRAEMVFIG